MAAEFYYELKEAFNKNEPFVLCTVVETIGSSPGTVGQKMIVHRNGETVGTVGGGVNEERVRLAAIDLFKNGTTKIMNFDLANPIEGDEPVCGGESRVFIELIAHQPRLIVFGAGHIGKVLAKMAALARFRVTVIDERPEYATDNIFPECDRVLCADYIESVDQANISVDDYVIVVTPGHVHDMDVLKLVLKKETKFTGLISSAKKLVEMKRVLKEFGCPEANVDKLFSPVGINLGSTTPEEIAVEILAQLVAFRNGKILKFEK